MKFQIGVTKNGVERAVNVAAVRKYIRAKVESIKDKVQIILKWLLFICRIQISIMSNLAILSATKFQCE